MDEKKEANNELQEELNNNLQPEVKEQGAPDLDINNANQEESVNNLQSEVTGPKNPILNTNNVNQEEKKYGDYSQNATQSNKQNKIVLIALLVLIPIIIIIGILIYYFGFYTNTEQMYKNMIGKAIDSYTKASVYNYKTNKANINVGVDVELEEVGEDDEMFIDLLNDLELNLGVQADRENQKAVVDMGLIYDGDDTLSAQVYLDAKEEKSYVYFKKLIDKYIEVEEEEDFYETLVETLQIEEKEVNKKAIQVIKEELANIVKPEYCSSKKVDININGKTVKATQNTIKMTEEQLMEELLTALSNIEKSEHIDDSEGLLKDFIDEIESGIYSDDIELELNIYTKGIIREIVKVSFIVYEDGSEATINVIKTSDTTYDLEFLVDDETAISGNITYKKENKEKHDITMSIDIKEVGEIKVDIEYTQQYNQKIDEIDIKDSVTMDELTEEDQIELVTNLEKSELYKLIENYSSSSGMIDESDDLLIDDDYPITDLPTNTNTSNLQDNEILTYGDEQKITFKIPSGYTTDRISDNFMSLYNEITDCDISVSTYFVTEQEYYEELKEDRQYYLDQGDYQNVTLTEMQTMEVNGRTFYYATLETQYDEYTYSTKYIWSKISTEDVIDIQIENPENITDAELKELLTITVENI